MHKLVDKANITSTQITDEGYLIANAVFSRSGIQEYLGAELGKLGDDAGKIFASYRSDDEVFNTDSLSSFTAKPVTDEHPSDFVNALNATQFTKGVVLGDVQRDGEHVTGRVIIYDAELAQSVLTGKAELSAGYFYDPIFENGTTPAGDSYQMKQTNIKINHVAVVEKGRCGATCKLGDSLEMTTKTQDCACKEQQAQTLTTINFDGLTVEVSPDIAAELSAKLSEVEASSVADKATIAALQSQLDQAKAVDVDALVASRLAFVEKIGGLDSAIDCSGKTETEVMREYLAKHSSVELESDEHIAVAFDAVISVKSSAEVATGVVEVSAKDTAKELTAHQKYLQRGYK